MVNVAGISVGPKTVRVNTGVSTDELEITIIPADASNQVVRWESNDETVAKVDSAGVVMGVFAGQTTITAITDDGGHTDTVTVEVDIRGPAGGLVFYRDEDNEYDWTYLEAAPYGWYDDGDDPDIEWSNVQDSQLGTTSALLGAGQSNTAEIIRQAGHSYSAARAAVEFVHVHEGVTYDDWFLPSRDELILMAENLAQSLIGNFKDDQNYWSSSESGADGAMSIRMPQAATWWTSKVSTIPVRPIRAFARAY